MGRQHISEIPSIEELNEITEAASKEELVIFVGAGLSKLLGCPLWSELAQKYLDHLLQSDCIKYKEYRSLCEMTRNPRKLLTICEGIAREANKPFTQMEKIFNPEWKDLKEQNKPIEIYEKLYSMNAMFVTTNYDTLLDKVANRPTTTLSGNSDEKLNEIPSNPKIFSKSEEMTIRNLAPGNVLHIHGSIEDRENMILTIDQYLEYYRKDSPINKFLTQIFSKFVVLFIGYGLDDLEILEHMLRNTQETTQLRKRYLLHEFYKDEDNLFGYMQKYFNSLKVELIPYDYGNKGYNQLVDIIDRWSNSLKHKQLHFYDKVKMLKEGEDKLIQIERNPKIEDYFFYNEEPDIHTFDSLKDYFKPEHILLDEDILQGRKNWSALSYLERFALQIKEGKVRRSFIPKIIDIIKNVTYFNDNHENCIKNNRIWWQFHSIILNFPNKYITNEVIGLVRKWMEFGPNGVPLGTHITTELLPKLLNSSSTLIDIKKAEKTLAIITTIKPHSDNSAKAKNSYMTFVDKYWLEKYFEKNNELIGMKCSDSVIIDICKKIKLILQKESKVVIYAENKPYQLVLRNINKKYELTLLKISSENKTEDEISQSVFFGKIDVDEIIKNWTFAECDNSIFIKKSRKKLNDSGIIVDDENERRINNLYHNLYNEGTFHSFYEIRNRHSSDLVGLFTTILKCILTTISRENISRTEKLLIQFFNEKELFFTKMAMYIIGINNDTYKDLFFTVVQSEKGSRIIDNYLLEDELKYILNNLINLSESQRSILKELIERGPQIYLYKESPEKIPIWKQERYQALSHDPIFRDHHDQLKKETHVEVELKPAIGKIQTRWGGGKSPIDADQLLTMPNIEIAEMLLNFRTSDPWNGPTVGGLSDEIQKLAKDQPEKFTEEMAPFINTSYFHINHILRGIQDAWKQKVNIQWAKLFDFLITYIDREPFWNDMFIISDDHWNADHHWVITSITNLIQDGSRDDKWAFEEHNNEIAKKLLFIIIDNLKEGNDPTSDDLIYYSLNSTFGSTITALIFLSLRLARLGNKRDEKHAVRWSIDIKEKYESLFAKGIIDSYVLFGEYIPQLMYLDKSWVESKVIKFEQLDDFYWAAFIEGYLYDSSVNKEMYSLMRKHYEKALEYSLKQDVTNKLVQHIALGYLYDDEDYSIRSLFGNMLSMWKDCHIGELVKFLVVQSDFLVENMDIEKVGNNEPIQKLAYQKILKFWKWIYEKITEEALFTSQNDQEIISDLADFIVLLPEINQESYDWLKLSAPFVNIDHRAYLFIKNLNRLKNKGNKHQSAQFVGELYLEMLQNSFPDYEEEDIRDIVEYLFELNDESTTELAKQICSKYGEQQMHFLVDIYEKYTGKL